ncbi:MAG: hypothetical protein KQH79_10440 [Bacteroidetes bacterium]|nr:hypothetical protein [Bacteroidota bacterium]
MKINWNISKYLVLLIAILGNACDNLDISSNQTDAFFKIYGSSKSDVGVDVKPFNDGYIVLSTVSSEDMRDIVLLQADQFGNILNGEVDTLSDIRGGDNTASKLLLTDDGGFIVLGTVEDTAQNNTNIYLNKFSAQKTSEWEKLIGGADNEAAAALRKTADGYIIAGSTDAQGIGNSNPQGKLDIYLIKTDQDGNIVWTSNHGYDGNDYASDIILIENGYLVVGTTEGSNGPGQAKDNIILVKTNANGGAPDIETYGSSNNDYGNSIINSSDGGFVILGTVEDVTGSKSDIYVIKLGEDIHNIIWSISYGEANFDDLGYEIERSNGGYIIVGSKELNTGYAGYLLKIDSDGLDVLENTYGGYGQVIRSIEKTSEQGFIMTGSSGAEGSEMISLIKVNSDGEL